MHEIEQTQRLASPISAEGTMFRGCDPDDLTFQCSPCTPAWLRASAFAYNPASQITQTVRTGDTYAWTGHFNENKAGTANGLNQLTAVGAKSLMHDTKGNVTAFGTKTFTYSSENLLLTGPSSTTLSYDPAMRLYQTVSGTSTNQFAYDGLDRIAEYGGSNALLRRYVHGPDIDRPIVWYEGSGTTTRRFLSSDERGSIISVTDSAGVVVGLNRYDEYGQPQSANLGAFGYTGQAWLPTIGTWYYKARIYNPELGRFLQPDPIDYAAGTNLYAYVRNDPVNSLDPLGLCEADGSASYPGEDCTPIVVSGTKKANQPGSLWAANDFIMVSYARTGFAGLIGGGGGESTRCKAPPISEAERKAAARGDRGKYWSSRFARGDPLGAIGLTTFTNSSILGQLANTRLRDAISSRSPRMGAEAVSREVQQIGVEIMRGHAVAVDRFGSPSAQQFAIIHFQVFQAHALPRSTFGAAPITGTAAEAALTSSAWMQCK